MGVIDDDIVGIAVELVVTVVEVAVVDVEAGDDVIIDDRIDIKSGDDRFFSRGTAIMLILFIAFAFAFADSSEGLSDDDVVGMEDGNIDDVVDISEAEED